MISFLKKYWISTLVVAIIFILCIMDTTPLPAPPVRDFDKFVHTLMFLGLSGVVFFDNTGYLRFPITTRRIFWSTFVFPIALGGLIEIIQGTLTKTRCGDWWDFLFDIFGGIFGMGVALLINRYFLMKKIV